MGGFFSSPAPPPPPPLPPVDNGEAEQRKQRLADIERRRRGRAGTITTSPKGFLTLLADIPKRKSLLGE